MNNDFKNGIKAGMTIVPTFVAIFIGVGIAAGAQNISAAATVLMTIVVFASPAQFAMIDTASLGTWLQVVSVGVLVNLRFFLMSITLSTLFGQVSRTKLMLWVQFVTATSYLATFFESRHNKKTNMLEFYKGVAVLSYPAAVIGTAIGAFAGRGLPGMFQFGASLFLPIYFSLLLIKEARGRREWIAIAAGFVGTPVLEILVPGWGIFIVALVTGVILVRIPR